MRNMRALAWLLIAMNVVGPNAFAINKIQKQGVKTAADCVAGGATAANCLIDTSQLYDLANAQQLSTSISNGQLGGGSGGSKNYLTSYKASTGAGAVNPGNGDAELNATTGWSLAHTNLSSGFPSSVGSAGVPFSSSAGGTAAAGGLSFTVSSSSPLQKSYSFLLSSSGASTAGDMLISDAFYIDAVDQTQPLYISLSSAVVSGASNLNFSGTSSNSFAVYAYDVTQGQWIQPSGVYGMVSSGTFSPKGIYFQPTSSASTRYQLAIVNINASAGAYSLKLDTLGVGPQATMMAPAVNDLQAYSPTIGAGSGSVSSAMKWSRVGTYMRIVGQLKMNNASTNTNITFTPPSGSSPDTTLLSPQTGFSGSAYVVGGSAIYTSATSGTNKRGTVFWRSDTTNFQFSDSSDVWKGSANNIPYAPATNDTIDVDIIFPVVGWSSNTVSSADTDTGIVAASYQGPTGTPQTSFTDITYGTKVDDKRAICTGTVCTVQTAGLYFVDASVRFNGSASTAWAEIRLAKNGSAITGTPMMVTTNQNQELSPKTSALLPLVAGDQIKVQAYESGYTSPSFSGGNFSITRLSGPAVVLATEDTAAQYGFTGSATAATGVYATTLMGSGTSSKGFDSHNAWSNGVYTCPSPGRYRVTAQVTILGIDSGASVRIGVAKNGTAVSSIGGQMAYVWNMFGIAQDIPAGGSAEIRCNQGDTLRVQLWHTSASARSIYNDPSYTWELFERVGN